MTLPAALRLAVASCQHWEFGHYAAHRQIAAAAPDLVAFLGDYIYERGPYSWNIRHRRAVPMKVSRWPTTVPAMRNTKPIRTCRRRTMRRRGS